MFTNLFFAAAVVIFFAVLAIMIPFIGKLHDIKEMTPRLAAWLSLRIFPLMLPFTIFAFLGSQASKWGWNSVVTP